MMNKPTRKTWVILTIVAALLLGLGAGAAYWYHETYKPRVICELANDYDEERECSSEITVYPRKPWEPER